MNTSQHDIDRFLSELTHALAKFGTRSKEVKSLMRLAAQQDNPELKLLAETKFALQREFEHRNQAPQRWDALLAPLLALRARIGSPGRKDLLSPILVMLATLLGVEFSNRWFDHGSPPADDWMNHAGTLNFEPGRPAIALDEAELDKWVGDNVGRVIDDGRLSKKISAEIETKLTSPEIGQSIATHIDKAFEAAKLEKTIAAKVEQAIAARLPAPAQAAPPSPPAAAEPFHPVQPAQP